MNQRSVTRRPAGASHSRRHVARRHVGWVPSLVLVLGAGAGCDRHRQSAEPEMSQAQLGKSNDAPVVVHQLTEKDGQVLSEVATRALPAVVSVASTRAAQVEAPGMPFPDDPFFRRFFGPEGEGLPFPMPPGDAPVQRGLGSGVLVAKDVILTNAHVVADAKEIVVTASDKRVLEAEVAGSDPKSDLAVLRVKSDTTGLMPLEFADSSSLALGQIVLAIGYPFGLGGTVTMGIVSAKGRADLGIVDYEDFLQTDAAINPGNSGGALIDLQGRLVGVPTAILSRSGGNMGVGFAIPSNMAKPIMTSLLEQGRVTRGFLGVTIQELDKDLAQSLGIATTNGVLVSEVSPGTPAEKAGLRRGDVLVAVDGRPVTSTGEFRNLIAAAGARAIELDVLRDGKPIKTRAELRVAPDERPTTPRADDAPSNTPAGLRLAPLDATARERLGLPAHITSGVVVNAVAGGSLAAQAGLMPGDVILEVDKQPVPNPQRFSEVWNGTNKPLALLIWRDGRTFFAVLKR